MSKEDVKTELNSIDIKKEDVKVKIKNLEEELAVHKKQNQNILNVNKELNDIKENTPFNLKQEFIKKWIDKIIIHFEKDIVTDIGYYHIEFEFNVPNLEPQVYFIHQKYVGLKDSLKKGYWA